MSTTINLALDWYPNIIHGGILIAQEAGYYADAGLAVNIISADADQYATYPIEKLAVGIVDIAMAPSEHLMHYRENKWYHNLFALGAIGQRDMSAVAYRQGGGITRPADLDGRKIACYGTFFEVEILSAMIKADGGQGNFEVIHPGKLALWDFFLDGHADACWMFPCWEGAMADVLGQPLGYFHLADYGIPYGQSPILIANREAQLANPAIYQSFMEATARGYQLMVQDPVEAMRIIEILKFSTAPTKAEILAVMAAGMPYFLPNLLDSGGQWGRFDEVLSQTWHQWLWDHNCLARVLT